MARPSRQALYADDPTFLWKLILRLFAILLALIGIGTLAWAFAVRIISPTLSSNPSDDTYNSYDNDYDDSGFEDFVFLPWSFIPLSLSVIWNVANIATSLSRNRPIHPGANVGCDLVLWLLFAVTGSFATIGALNYIGNYVGGYDDDDSSYGETYPNGTAIACGGFTSCSAQTTYAKALEHKGIVIAVGCAMEFAVLIIHFALFISACRYTHARRYNTSSIKAKAITAEATEIARRMIADLTTGPNGQLQPLLQQPQQQGMQQTGPWPLPQNEEHQAGGAYQPQGPAPIQQHSTAQQQQMAREQAMQRRYEGTSPVPTGGEGSSVAAGKRADQPPPEIMIDSPTSARDSQIHPTLRAGRDRDSISYA